MVRKKIIWFIFSHWNEYLQNKYRFGSVIPIYNLKIFYKLKKIYI